MVLNITVKFQNQKRANILVDPNRNFNKFKKNLSQDFGVYFDNIWVSKPIFTALISFLKLRVKNADKAVSLAQHVVF